MLSSQPLRFLVLDFEKSRGELIEKIINENQRYCFHTEDYDDFTYLIKDLTPSVLILFFDFKKSEDKIQFKKYFLDLYHQNYFLDLKIVIISQDPPLSLQDANYLFLPLPISPLTFWDDLMKILTLS